MFRQYYHTKYNNDHIYYSLINNEQYLEVSLYINNKLVKRKSIPQGIHLIEHDDIKIKLNAKLFKIENNFSIANQKIDIKKLNRKEIIPILKELGYYNDINPRPIQHEPFKINSIFIPLLFILLVNIIDLVYENKSKLWGTFSIIILVMAYFQLFAPVINRIPITYIEEDEKGKVKFLVAFFSMVLTQITISKFT